jgi:hypothetical protein
VVVGCPVLPTHPDRRHHPHVARMNPHVIAAVLISCAAFGFALAAFSLSLIAVCR